MRWPAADIKKNYHNIKIIQLHWCTTCCSSHAPHVYLAQLSSQCGAIAGAILEFGLRVGGIPLNLTPRHIFLTVFLSLHSQRVQKPLRRTLSAVFCTKLRLNNCARMV